MYSRKNNQQGFSHLGILLIIVTIGLISLVGWRVFNHRVNTAVVEQPNNNVETLVESPKTQELIWQQREGGWTAMQTAPACPDQPMMKMPAELSKVTGILYPGQTRGGNYKPHGGFRLDDAPNESVTVVAPLDGFIVRGGSYLAEGEIQYTFDIMNNCGVMYRVGHFRKLPDNLQTIANTWPEPQEGDSRTHQVNPPIHVKQGDILATAVGIIKNKNTFFDWGVYDYRQENEASKSPAYQQAHASDKELSWHAICWFDLLPKETAAKIRSLPAGDPTSGKKSDYCKN